MIDQCFRIRCRRLRSVRRWDLINRLHPEFRSSYLILSCGCAATSVPRQGRVGVARESVGPGVRIRSGAGRGIKAGEQLVEILTALGGIGP